MIICLQLSQQNKDELDALLIEGQYRDYSEAVTVAISNQLLLHRSATTGANATMILTTETAKRHSGDSHPSHPSSNGIPSLFSALEGQSGRTIKTDPLNLDGFAQGEAISIDQWIWGQHNKLLPAKAACRAIARLTMRESQPNDGIPLSKAATEIASEAVKLGDYLRRKDRELGLQRDEILAHAFPKSEAEVEGKSRLRFASQFVGSIDSQGVFTGLPADLKLLATDGPRGTRIHLTDHGWTFACMENPVLDADHTQPGRKFTADEVDFLFKHIIQSVPYEAFAFTTVVRLIANGANTPDLLDQALREFLPERDGKGFSSSFLTTQRAGVISRLSDLGFVARVRDGIKVAYAVSGHGYDCFAQLINGTAQPQ